MNSTQQIKINDKKTINGWALFDWANSSYSLVITATIFPAYFISVTGGSDEPLQIYGISISNSVLYSYAIAIAYFIITILSPILSGIADYGNKRKAFLKFFTYMGAFACIALFFFKGVDLGMSSKYNSDQVLYGTIAFMIATMGFAGALVYYNSYLPVIVSEDQYDRVSAKGFAYGFIGSVILLIISLIIIQKPELFGIQDVGVATRISFILVGLWWIGFAQVSFKRLPNDGKNKINKSIVKKGWQEIVKVWNSLKGMAYTKRFLFSFFFYSAGVQTSLFLASTFAEKELEFGTSELIVLILLLQIVAIFGAYLFSYISGKVGNKKSLLSMLVIWISICVAGYFVDQKLQFYIIACLVGLVMGGVQSLSRSTYSKMIPKGGEDTTSYFSFYDILEKASIVIGTLGFGLVEQISGGMRNSLLFLSVFFLLGILLMLKVKVQTPSVRLETE